jgi:hypothetical protein
LGNEVWPSLPGLHWELKVKDEFFNLVSKAAAPGYETRISLGPDPLLHLELSYDFLREPGSPDNSLPAGADDELQILRGFFRARQGDFDSFLIDLGAITGNPAESSVAGQPLTPDASAIAPLIVSWSGGYNENIYELQGTPQLYMSGQPMVAGTDYTIQGPGYADAGVTYPGLVAVIIKAITGPITADIGWYYRVRFEQGMQEFDKFLALLYSAQQIQLVTTRTS